MRTSIGARRVDHQLNVSHFSRMSVEFRPRTGSTAGLAVLRPRRERRLQAAQVVGHAPCPLPSGVVAVSVRQAPINHTEARQSGQQCGRRGHGRAWGYETKDQRDHHRTAAAVHIFAQVVTSVSLVLYAIQEINKNLPQLWIVASTRPFDQTHSPDGFGPACRIRYPVQGIRRKVGS